MRLLFLKSFPVTAGRFAAVALLAGLSACASKAPVQAAPAVVTPDQANAQAASGTQIYTPTGIKKWLTYISPYRVSIQQGNFVSEEMMAQIKEGMTREQVRFVLGSALLTDMFHEDRWDYPFRLAKPNGEVVVSRVSIFFKNNTVAKYEGGNLPTEKEYLARITESALGKDRIESTMDIDGNPKKKDKN